MVCAQETQQMIHILTYTFSPNYLKARTPHRANHFKHLTPFIDRNELLLGGATKENSPEGILIFNQLSKQEIITFADADPYIINKVATSYTIIQWNVVAGSLMHHIDTD